MVLILIRELMGWIGIGKVEWAESGHLLQLQTKRVRLKKADAQGHEPFLSGCKCSEGQQ
jgi:hypothetical protein